ncbi:uncharacterized protein [Procambarus clarkii]|uniref:uncharacterized protein n=1 Tax=Procambarus clarkii TaxID=6728 RepID=UPI003742C519
MNFNFLHENQANNVNNDFPAADELTKLKRQTRLESNEAFTVKTDNAQQGSSSGNNSGRSRGSKGCHQTELRGISYVKRLRELNLTSTEEELGGQDQDHKTRNINLTSTNYKHRSYDHKYNHKHRSYDHKYNHKHRSYDHKYNYKHRSYDHKYNYKHRSYDHKYNHKHRSYDHKYNYKHRSYNHKYNYKHRSYDHKYNHKHQSLPPSPPTNVKPLTVTSQ